MSTSQKPSALESEIHPSHKSDDLYKRYFALPGDKDHSFVGVNCAMIQWKLPPQFPLLFRLLRHPKQRNCITQLQKRTTRKRERMNAS